MAYDISEESQEGQENCLECGQEIPYGRLGQKFCSQTCRNRHHNRMNKDIRHLKLKTLNRLEKNHSLLSDMLENNIESAELWELQVQGFCPEFVTSCHRGRGFLQLCCYDIAYRMTESKVFSLKRLHRMKSSDNDSDI